MRPKSTMNPAITCWRRNLKPKVQRFQSGSERRHTASFPLSAMRRGGQG